MREEGASQQQGRLEAAVIADPGAPGFSALAELYRREGRLADAEAVVRAGLAAKPDAWEGRVAFALVLLDRGLEVEARLELERLIDAGASLQGVSLPTVPGSAPALDAPPSTIEPEPEAGMVSVATPFATGTMADLLESQGDVEGALRIRAALDVEAPEPEFEAQAAAPNTHLIKELSRWLANAQRRMGERA